MKPSRPIDNKSVEEILDEVLAEAVYRNASDIHIEPYTNFMRIRLRIEGTLHEFGTFKLVMLEQMVSRIKAISGLDIASRAPQDGRFEAHIDLFMQETQSTPQNSTKSIRAQVWIADTSSREGWDAYSFGAHIHAEPHSQDKLPIKTYYLNVRVSVFPTVYGEAVVMRLLNREDMLMNLSELGMDNDTFTSLETILMKNYGMVLVSGPAGSGKTTTLYSILYDLKSEERNIVTLEDPVEVYFGDIRQTQIKPRINLTFSTGLRSIMRQDPDVIMIGEIRDPETAEYALRASLTGRLVFSTIHAGTAVGTIARLIDMGLERSLVAYALNGIIAQRLVKKICNYCRQQYTPDEEYLRFFGIDPSSQTFTRGVGCNQCHKGYSGRVGVFTILKLDQDMRSMIVEKASMYELQKYISSKEYVDLREKLAAKIREGVITAEEAIHAL